MHGRLRGTLGEMICNPATIYYIDSRDEVRLIQTRYYANPGILATVLVTAAVFCSVPVEAQATGQVSGTVTDSAGAPIYSAQVSVAGLSYQVITGEDGSFFLRDVPVGPGILTVRRLGFAPASAVINLTDSRTPLRGISLKLAHLPTFLQTVFVQTKRVDYRGRLAGYYQRLEKRDGGYFITRDQIDRENPRSLGQLLQRVPAISGRRMRGGGSGVRMRGRNCAPLVWLDATPMPAGEFDLDGVSPQTLQGIELYLGSTTAPARFILNGDENSCGTIILWSRGPDTDPIGNQDKSALDLERLIASLSVFTVDQVDTRAELAKNSAPVSYPAPLFAERIGGTVVAEFVVDTAGRVEPGSFGIISSTNPLFSDAVREAVENSAFIPAERHGLKVRQLIQQPFSFVPPRTGAGG